MNLLNIRKAAYGVRSLADIRQLFNDDSAGPVTPACRSGVNEVDTTNVIQDENVRRLIQLALEKLQQG